MPFIYMICGNPYVGYKCIYCVKENDMKYYIEIVNFETGDTTERMEATSERTAEKIERGVNINLNHEEYFTRIVEEEGETK